MEWKDDGFRKELFCFGGSGVVFLVGMDDMHTRGFCGRCCGGGGNRKKAHNPKRGTRVNTGAILLVYSSAAVLK